VFRAIHKSVLTAYAERPNHLPDPFEGGMQRASAHVDQASRMALVQAQGLAPAGDSPWVVGTGPAAFWLAWALGSLGRPVAGFVGTGPARLLGVPVASRPPEGAPVVEPRVRGFAGVRQGLRWLVRGLPVQDHPLKRLPGDVMAGLLVPFQLRTPDARQVWIHGDGPLAAYLAFAAEHLGGIEVQGFMGGPSPWPALPVARDPEGAVWHLDS
jgi:hypothetical protein